MRKTINIAAAISAVADAPATQLTVSELVRAYNVAKCDGSDSRLKKWLDAFGNKSAWTLSSESLEAAAQAMLEHGYAPSSANRDLSALGSCYRWAKSKRLTPRGFKSPTVGVRRYEEKIRRVHVDGDQVEALRVRALAFRDRRFGAFVSLLIETGARKSELLERRWSDVDLDRLEMVAPVTKNGTPRVLFFSQETANLMRRVWPEAQRRADRMLFEGRVPGQAIDYKKAWATVTYEVGLPDLHMHDVRHAAAARLLKAGVVWICRKVRRCFRDFVASMPSQVASFSA